MAELDAHLESLLLRVKKESEAVLNAIATRDLWLKRAWKAGATSRQLGQYSGLSHVAALKAAQKRPTRGVLMEESAGRYDGITREAMVEDH